MCVGQIGRNCFVGAGLFFSPESDEGYVATVVPTVKLFSRRCPYNKGDSLNREFVGLKQYGKDCSAVLGYWNRGKGRHPGDLDSSECCSDD